MKTVIMFAGFLILVGILARYYKGVTAIIRDSASGTVKVVERLQMRGEGYNYGR